jgi:hypothetical protein
MMKTPLTIIVGIAYLSLTASAQIRRPDLSKYFTPTALGGFNVPSGLKVPEVAGPKGFIMVEAGDEIYEALTALRRETSGPKGILGDIVRMLGFKFADKQFLADAGAEEKNTNTFRYFNSTEFRGKLDILLSEFDAKERKLYTYLISPAGALEAATVTIKVDGKFKVDKLSMEVAAPKLKEQLTLWVKYYRENIKLAQKT